MSANSRKRSRPKKLDQDQINSWAFFACRTKSQDYIIEEAEDCDDYVSEYDDASILLPKRQKVGETEETEESVAKAAELHSVLSTAEPPTTTTATINTAAIGGEDDVDPNPAPPSRFVRRSAGFLQPQSKSKLAQLEQQMSNRTEDDDGLIYLKTFSLELNDLNITGNVSQVLFPLLVTMNDLTGDVIARITLYDKAGAIVATIPAFDTSSKLSIVEFATISYCCEHNIATLKCYPKQDDSAGLEVKVFLRASVFLNDTTTDPSHSEKHVYFVSQLMEWCFMEDPDTQRLLTLDVESDHPVFSAGLIYDSLRPSILAYKPPPLNLNSANLDGKLKSDLFQHQKMAVAWMMERESSQPFVFAPEELESFWRSLTTPNGHTFAFNLLTGNFSRSVGTHVHEVKGGILADQMGLGKTVEVISLILSNTRPEVDLTAPSDMYPNVAMKEGDDPGETRCYCGQAEEEALEEDTQVYCEYCQSWQHSRCVGFSSAPEEKYMCPECHDANPNLFSIKSTLIIVPGRIVNQWMDEIKKHVANVDALKILLYTGVKNPAEDPTTGCLVVRPTQFANYDVVITTFETLQKEFPHLTASQTNARNSRRPKRYRVLPSPLLSVQWWRVCIDESQSLKEGATGAARLASHIPAVNRWGVSGTPITKGIEDLFGLLQFLQLEPYCDRDWWYRTINSNYNEGVLNSIQRLHAVLKRVMWRTSKSDVKLDLLEPIEEFHRLKLSEVEKFLYEARYIKCTERVAQILDSKNKSSRLVLRKAITNVNSLRQACDHPQLGANTGFTAIEKATLSMGEMLDQLIIRARTECEDANRQVVVALNGLAGLKMLEEKFNEAAGFYRQVLSENNEVAVDTSLKIHSLHSLQESLRITHDPNNEIGDLKIEEARLRTKFLGQNQERLHDSRQQVDIVSTQLVQLHWLEMNNEDSWWRKLIDEASDSQSLLDRIKNDLAGHQQVVPSVSDRFRDYHGLIFTISQLLEELASSRGEVFSIFQKICVENPTEQMIAEVEACPKCSWQSKANRSKIRCSFCKATEALATYTRCVYLNANVDWEDEEDEAMDDGERGDADGVDNSDKQPNLKNWIKRLDSELERIFSCLTTFAQMRDLDKSFRESGSQMLKIFTALKKEIVALGIWLNRGLEMVLSLNTLHQCTRRIELRRPGEKVEPEEENVRILAASFPAFEHKFNGDKMMAMAQLKTALTRFSYLQKLQAKELSAQQSESNTCPICTHELQSEVIMWTCGHVFCPNCVEKMIKDATSHRATQIKCPNCRARMNIQEISRVQKAPKAPATITSTTTATRSTPSPDGEEMEVEIEADEPVISIQGSYGTKIDAIVRFLKGLSFREPDVKVLIFSQWNDILKVIGGALAKNGVSCMQFTSGKKGQQILTTFKTDPSITALGMSLERSNQGLTLIEASRVIIVEPSLILAHEQQAIGRIYRIGQKKQIHVHRFVISDTVEEQVFELARSMAGDSTLTTASSGIGSNKKEEDLFSAMDITHLLGLDKEEKVVGEILETEAKENGTEGTEEDIDVKTLLRYAAYWNTLVVYTADGSAAKQLPRMEALTRITNRRFVERLEKRGKRTTASAAMATEDIENEESEEVEEMVELSGKVIPRPVALILTGLPVVDHDVHENQKEDE